MEFLRATDSAAQRRVLTDHPELVSIHGLAAMDALILQSTDMVVDALLRRRTLLERCLGQGIDRAFGHSPGDSAARQPPADGGMHERLSAILGVDPSAIQVTPTGPNSGQFTVTSGGAERFGDSPDDRCVESAADMARRAIQLHLAPQSADKPTRLRHAVELLRNAVACTDSSCPEHFWYLGSLGIVLRDLGIATDDVSTQDEALEHLRVALAGAKRSGEHPEMENNLAVALRDRYHRSGQVADLIASIASFRQAARTNDPQLRAQIMDNLGLALRSRYLRLGDLADLEESVVWHRQAVELVGEWAMERPRYLTDLGAALRIAAEHQPTAELLDEAISMHEMAVMTIPPTDGFRRICLHDLITGLLARFQNKGSGQDLDRLVEAEDDLRRILEAQHMPPSSAELNDRATILLLRVRHTGSDPTRVAGDLGNAEAALRRAISLHTDGVPEQSALRANLATCLRLQNEWHLAGVTPEEVTSMYRAACEHGLRAGADIAVGAAIDWSAWAEHRAAEDAAGWPEAVEAYEYALEALHRTVALQLGRMRKQVRLRQLSGVPARAALACLRARAVHPAGELPERAVVMFERGRALLLSESIDLEAARLVDLARSGHADLTDRFQHLIGTLRELDHREPHSSRQRWTAATAAW